MKRLIERVLIKILKVLNVDILAHAHVQIAVGHNTYSSGENYVIDNLISEILKDSPLCFFDVGANVGDYTKLIRKNFPVADIYCFEPVTETFAQLEKNTEQLKTNNFNVAVGSGTGKLLLYHGSSDTERAMVTAYKNTLSDIFTYTGYVDEGTEYNMITIDDFCENKVYRINLLKVDVEGHELEVLKGACKMIDENRIDVIQFEFNEFNISARTFLYDYYKILPQYKFYRIMPQNKLYPLGNYSSSNEIFRYQNILAVNNHLNYVYRSR